MNDKNHYNGRKSTKSPKTVIDRCPADGHPPVASGHPQGIVHGVLDETLTKQLTKLILTVKMTLFTPKKCWLFRNRPGGSGSFEVVGAVML
jgi:hypothetical protein